MRSSTTRMITVLSLTAILSGGVLAGFYSYLEPIIETNQKKADLESGFKGIFPQAADFKEISPATSAEADDAIYQAISSDGQVLGVAFKTTGKGFEGPIKMALGLSPDYSKLVGVRVLQMSETPGLGSRIQEPGFTDQFNNKPLTDSFQLGQDVDGITGATMSSRAVVTIIRDGIQQATQRLGKPVTLAAAGGTESSSGETGSGAGSAEITPVSSNPEEALASITPDVSMFVSVGTFPVNEAPTNPEVYQGIGLTGETAAIGFKASAKGMDGDVVVIGSLDAAKQKLIAVRVLEQHETAGLGDKVATDGTFLHQFDNKPVSSAFEVGQDVDAITGATVSSKAVAQAVRYGIEAVKASGL